MNIEEDEECTADYGVFGDQDCNCSICKPLGDLRPYLKASERPKWMSNSAKISADFNSHMIYLFNQNAKRNPR